ncbi:hypothetical protein OSTOST_24610 [Ostertagia ostertagi]
MPLCDPAELTRISMRIADDGKMTFVDARVSQLLGLTPDQLVGRFWWQVVHPSDEQSLHESFMAMMTRDQPMRLNLPYSIRRTTIDRVVSRRTSSSTRSTISSNSSSPRITSYRGRRIVDSDLHRTRSCLCPSRLPRTTPLRIGDRNKMLPEMRPPGTLGIRKTIRLTRKYKPVIQFLVLLLLFISRDAYII